MEPDRPSFSIYEYPFSIPGKYFKLWKKEELIGHSFKMTRPLIFSHGTFEVYCLYKQVIITNVEDLNPWMSVVSFIDDDGELINGYLILIDGKLMHPSNRKYDTCFEKI